MVARGWSNRSFLLSGALVLVAALFVTLLTSEYRTALREVERVGGSTDATSFDGEHRGPVRRVSLCGPTITDTEVERVAPHLSQFPELFTLDLSMARVTDEGLGRLRGLKRLGDLLLRCTRVSDDGMAHLQGWDGLVTLDLMRTRVTDRGLEQVARNHPGLRALDLDGTSVTDRGLEHLKALPKLEWLAVADTAVTDRGLACVGELRNLQLLSVSGTRVTGAGLEHLKGLRRLRTLALQRTNVSYECLGRLRTACPGLRIVR
jgi:hypothetical protein